MEKIIRLVATNDRGMRIGQTHHRAQYSDALVDQVRDMHEDQGMGYGAIARQLDISKSTVRDWCRYDKRAQTPEKWKRAMVQKPTTELASDVGALITDLVTED